MTDRPMDGTLDTGEHPDEGLIHAWLDEALDAAESERLAAHVRGCAACQAQVAEARGLIAGASRIIAALDDVPAGARSGWAQSAVSSAASPVVGAADVGDPERLPQRSLWRYLRVTPGRAALAATILVALGITLTQERLADDSATSMARVLNPQRADAPALDSAAAESAPLAKAESVPPRDELLNSAVARNLEMSQGRRTIGAAPGQPLPQAPPNPAPDAPAGLDSRRVVEGRAEAQTQREITGAGAADRARAGITGRVASAPARNPITTSAAPLPRRKEGGENEQMAGRPVVPEAAPTPLSPIDGSNMAHVRADAVANTCLRLDSSDPDSKWGGQPFPMVVALEAGPADSARNASVLTVAGAPTSLRARWTPRRGDSVSIALRRIGYTGTIALGPEAGVRTGVAVSGPYEAQLEQVVVADAPATAQARARGAVERADTRKAAAPPAAAAAPTAGTAAQVATEPGPPVRQLRITARPIACPSR